MDDASELSYLHTPALQPYIYSTVNRVASDNARLRPNQELFVLRELDGSRSSLTNASLYKHAVQLARYLASQGITKGDMVALVGPNTLEMVVGTLGILMAGAVVLNTTINMKTAQDQKKLLEVTKVKCILADRGKDSCLLSPIKAMLNQCDVQKDYTTDDDKIKVIFLRQTDLEGFTMTNTLPNILSENMKKVELPNVIPEDPAIIFTTSGSTGIPKMVLHSQYNLASYPFSWTPTAVDYDIVVYNDRPFSWIGGTPVLSILRSMPRVFMDASITMNGEKTDFLWKVVKEEQCTDALFFPYIILDLLQLPPDITDDGFRLHHIATGGQIVDNLFARVNERFCHAFMVVYGCTELVPISARGPVQQGERLQAGDVGVPYSGVEIRIVDTHEKPLPLGTVGKVQIRSPYSMICYVANEKLSKDVFSEERWFRTGDVGKISGGHLIVIGREKDIISRGTRKVYPSMLEYIIKQMESVKDVCVVAVPDKRLYEEICVCFTRSGKLTPDDVQKYCKQNLFQASTVDGLGEMPTYFLLFEAFPKLNNGKTDKGVLARDATVRLGLT